MRQAVSVVLSCKIVSVLTLASQINPLLQQALHLH